MSKAHAVRLGEDLSAWVEDYAKRRGVKASDLLRTAIESFREDCRTGVPAIEASAGRVRLAGRSAVPVPAARVGASSAQRAAPPPSPALVGVSRAEAFRRVTGGRPR